VFPAWLLGDSDATVRAGGQQGGMDHLARRTGEYFFLPSMTFLHGLSGSCASRERESASSNRSI
jgi:hypothetical protein